MAISSIGQSNEIKSKMKGQRWPFNIKFLRRKTWDF